jgi:hypothetical protein
LTGNGYVDSFALFATIDPALPAHVPCADVGALQVECGSAARARWKGAVRGRAVRMTQGRGKSTTATLGAHLHPIAKLR